MYNENVFPLNTKATNAGIPIGSKIPESSPSFPLEAVENLT